jgi:hypothetical protein
MSRIFFDLSPDVQWVRPGQESWEILTDPNAEIEDNISPDSDENLGETGELPETQKLSQYKKHSYTVKALVLSGGGSKGAFAGGVVEFLLKECGEHYDILVGSSTGP